VRVQPERLPEELPPQERAQAAELEPQELAQMQVAAFEPQELERLF
jgi:hypothetical protein